MAESSEQGWWSSWIQTAKEKSANALDFVKKDLVEFQSTMKTDTTKIAAGVKEKVSSENAIAATQKAKEGVNSIFGGITKALIVEAEDKPVKKVTAHSTRQIFDRSKARVNAIQVDPDTYISEPSGSKDEFEEWLKMFNLDDQKGEISELLVIHVEVRALYTQLVPSQVSHADFWRRYFYKMHQLQLDEKRKAALMKRADDVQEQVGWDDEDDWCDLEGPSSPPRQSGMHLAAKALSQAESKSEPGEMDESEEDSSGLAASEQNTQDTTEPVTAISSSTENKVSSTDATVPKSSIKDDHSITEGVSPKQLEPKIDSPACQSTESSLSISSLTDDVKAMETSADTLTMVSPLEEVSATELKPDCPVRGGEKEETCANDEAEPKASSEENVQIKETEEDGGGEAEESCVEVTASSSSSEEEMKTKVKGDMVVVGSGVSSDRTTPASSEGSNKETDDDWEREFEVSEDDLKNLQTKTSTLTAEADNVELEDDWESWD